MKRYIKSSEDRLTPAFVQYYCLSHWAACVPQNAITIINDNVFMLSADDGDYYFLYRDGQATEIDKQDVPMYS